MFSPQPLPNNECVQEAHQLRVTLHFENPEAPVSFLLAFQPRSCKESAICVLLVSLSTCLIWRLSSIHTSCISRLREPLLQPDLTILRLSTYRQSFYASFAIV